jgi:hypothetical protein
MNMTGLYLITLLPGADERAFVTHMTGIASKDLQLLHSTRVTRGFTERLMKTAGIFPQYVWQVTVDLMTDSAVYAFHENVGRLQESIRSFGVVTGLDVYTHVEA